MTTGYVLHVGWSSSVRYALAHALAMAAPGATCTGEGRAAVVRVPLPDLPPTALVRLLHVVQGWKGTALWLDDTPLPRLALWHLAATAECAAACALGGAGILHCWGLVDGQTRSVPCQFLNHILPHAPDGIPVVAWVTAIQAAARVRTVAACAFWNPQAMTAAVTAWADGRPPERAWQRWLDAQTADRLLADVDLGPDD